LFAKDIGSVESLRDRLVEQGLDIQSRAADIQLVRKLDDNLMLLFSIVAMLGMTGCIVGLGMTLWAAVERKRKEIAVMQLLGLHPSSLAIFPIAQAVLTSSLGVAVAFLAYAGHRAGPKRPLRNGPREICRGCQTRRHASGGRAGRHGIGGNRCIARRQLSRLTPASQ
jgi:hypothetical protein